MKFAARHQCIIYSGAPSAKLPAIASVMLEMMAKGYQCLYLNSPVMVTGMRSCIAAQGIDVAAEIAEKRLLFSSETVLEGDKFNGEQMLQKLEATLDQALADGFKGLWASGDMTWELGADKNFEKLLEYEWKLEELFRRRKELHGICQYHSDTLPQSALTYGLLMHSSVFVNETLTRFNPHYNNHQLPVEPLPKNTGIEQMIIELCKPDVERSSE